MEPFLDRGIRSILVRSRPSDSLYEMSSLSSHGSVINSYSPDHSSSITDLNETVKSPPLKPLRISGDLAEHCDGDVFDDGNGSRTEEEENNSVIVAESDEEDEIEHFDSADFMMANLDETGENKYEQADLTQSSMEAQTANIGMAGFCSFGEAQESE
jgi:hypothetical protein